jgi:hypothetical protein
VIPALGSGRYSPGPHIGLPSWFKGSDPNFTIKRLFKKFSPLNGKGFLQVIAVVHVVLEEHAADFKKSQETFRSPGPEVR